MLNTTCGSALVQLFMLRSSQSRAPVTNIRNNATSLFSVQRMLLWLRAFGTASSSVQKMSFSAVFKVHWCVPVFQYRVKTYCFSLVACLFLPWSCLYEKEQKVDIQPKRSRARLASEINLSNGKFMIKKNSQKEIQIHMVNCCKTKGVSHAVVAVCIDAKALS